VGRGILGREGEAAAIEAVVLVLVLGALLGERVVCGVV
jgi:hypothetical protein